MSTISTGASFRTKLPKQYAFLPDTDEIRPPVLQHLGESPVTTTYDRDLESVISVLNAALATELGCILRYKCHHYMANEIQFKTVAEEFLKHAADEQDHADRIAKRITQLRGEPNFSPEGTLAPSHAKYVESETLLDMIRKDWVEERIAVEFYSEIIRQLGDNDPASRRLLEEILAHEVEHAEDMKTLLERVGSDKNRHEH